MGQGLNFSFVLDGREVWRCYGSDPGSLPADQRVFISDISGWMGEPGKARTEGRGARIRGGTVPLRRVGLDGRTISMSGWAEPPEGVDVDAWALQQPGRIFPSDTAEHTLVLYSWGHGCDVHAVVELDGECTFTASHGENLVEWHIPLHAPDIYLYGLFVGGTMVNRVDGVGLEWPLFAGDPPAVEWGVNTADTQVVLHNPGTIEAWPTVALSGNALSGARVSDGQGNVVEFSGPCTWDSPVTIDFASGEARRGGVSCTEQIIRRGFWRVPPESDVAPTVESRQSGTVVQADFRMTPRWL